MEIAEGIGFIHFWGFTPALNLFTNSADSSELNILISGSGDIRHLLLSLSEECTNDRFTKINFYIQESDKEVIARDILLLFLINEVQLPVRERVELFYDIYANALTRERTANYISLRAQELIKIVTQHRTASEIKKFFDFSCLKFKERDELEETFRAWHVDAPFDMGAMRDQRLRYHYKDRYDHRVNLIDWDYQWEFKKLAPQVTFRHYKEWRQSGVAYDIRLATYISPNRTLSGYIPGQKKKTRDSVLVRGYWGDILMSPYWAFGTDVFCCEDCNKILNKIGNMDRIHNAIDISEFNMTRIITRLETLQDYHFPPEKDKSILYKKYWAGEEIKQEDPIPETDLDFQGQSFLPAFQKFDIKIYPIMESLVTISNKNRFKNIFDRVVIGGASSSAVGEAINKMIKGDAIISVETVNNLINVKPEPKAEAMTKLRDLLRSFEWEEIENTHNFIHLRKNNAENNNISTQENPPQSIEPQENPQDLNQSEPNLST